MLWQGCRWQLMLVVVFAIACFHLIYLNMPVKRLTTSKSMFATPSSLPPPFRRFPTTGFVRRTPPVLKTTPVNRSINTPLPSTLAMHKDGNKTNKSIPQISVVVKPIIINTPLVGNNCDEYVIFSDSLRDGRGLGNQIFTMVAGLMVAQLTNRRLVMDATLLNHTSLESVFSHRYERINVLCQKYLFVDHWNLAYNPDVENFREADTLSSQNVRRNIANKSIVLGGFFQSWRYALNENHLRHFYLSLKDGLVNETEKFFESIRPAEWPPHTYFKVGVHVRRGDVLTEHNVKFGYTTPNASYFVAAMNAMLTLFKKVQFIVVSNDMPWCKQQLNSTLLSPPLNTNTYIAFSSGKSVAKDFARISSCHHNIMSTGTFGWWAAFINRGTTIYFKDWPKKGSTLAQKFKQEDFFPPSWIAMSD